MPLADGLDEGISHFDPLGSGKVPPEPVAGGPEEPPVIELGDLLVVGPVLSNSVDVGAFQCRRKFCCTLCGGSGRRLRAGGRDHYSMGSNLDRRRWRFHLYGCCQTWRHGQKGSHYFARPFTDSIRFLNQLLTLVRACRFDTEQMDPDTVALCDLNADPRVFVAGHQNRITHGTISGQFDKIGDDQAVHTLLLSGAVDKPKPKLDVAARRNLLMILGQSLGGYPIIPIYA